MPTPASLSTLPRRLLVGNDETPHSTSAMRAALDLAQALAARVELLHAVHVPIFEWMALDPLHPTGQLDQVLSQAAQRMRAHLLGLGLGERAADSIESLQVRPGKPAAVLLAQAERELADLFVLGAHHQRGWIDFGSTAQSLLSKSNIPIWIQAQPPRPIKKILAPVDLSEDSLSALTLACTLARSLGARVQAVQFFDLAAYFASTPDALGLMPHFSVEKTREHTLQQFDRRMQSFDWQGVEHSADFREGEPVQGILELGRHHDLIAMATHGRTGLARAVLGSVARRVLAQAPAAAVAIPHSRRKFLF